MRHLFLFTSLGFIIGLVSFNETESDTYYTAKNLKAKDYTEEEINYFNEITLKNELNPKIRLAPAKFKRDVKIFIFDYETFISDNPDLKRNNKLKNCEGFFTTKSKGDEIKSSRIFINIPRQDSYGDTKDGIREELTQQLGFFNDTWRYKESCFYQGQNEVLEYSDIDIKLIKMLYNE